jgi:glutamine amidotransferase
MEVSQKSGPEVVVIDYGMGNLRSVCRAFAHAGGRVRLIAHPDELGSPDALVFPGQGAIMDTMRLLQETGWDHRIREWIEADRPFFGICLGLQALFTHSEEGDTPGLDIFPGSVRRFRFPVTDRLKVPHMGWNRVRFAAGREPPLLSGLSRTEDQFYFVHSYYVTPDEPELVWGRTDYGRLDFCSAIRRGNLVATQFHPEKSQACGLRLYRNFLEGLSSGNSMAGRV